MKEKFVNGYLLWILIYTAVYFGTGWFFDVVLNGVLLETVYRFCLKMPAPYVASYWLIEHRYALYVAAYAIGGIVLSGLYVYRCGKRFDEAAEALDTLAEDRTQSGKHKKLFVEFERRLQEIQTKLAFQEQMRRMAEQQKDDLVVYLAHDLKTPLTSVIGYLSLLDESPDLPIGQRARYTGIALDKAYRLEDLINELFDVTRFHLQGMTLQKSSIDLALLLRQLTEDFYPILEAKHMAVHTELAEGLTVRGDSDKLARLFDNLLRNAVNYGYAGTPIHLCAQRCNGEVCIHVCNHGDELPAETMEHIFEKFYRADDARRSTSGGAGLGLAIAKQIVQLHGGTIEADSDAERTMFTVHLPAAPVA